MRLASAALLTACMAACAPSSTASPSPSPPPAPASVQQLTPYYGSYRDASGDLVVIARLGWFFDMKTAAYRTIYASSNSAHFTIGPRFLEPSPTFAGLTFTGQTLTISEGGQVTKWKRVPYPEASVTIPAGGATLAGALTMPLGAGPHPGIVIVHGAERGERHFYDVWVGIYASLGFAVLTYDKRGVGESSGTYPGESLTPGAIDVYAADAAAARDFLARQPGIDPARVGFHGGSQGGWTVPLAITRHGGGAFAVLVSAPTTTVDQTDLWAGFTSGGTTAPSESSEQMQTAVRSASGGYDPAAALHAMTAPALWVLGTNDRTVPTTICVEILTALHKSNFTVHLVPTGHALLVNATGMVADDAQSPGLPPDLVPTLRQWLAAEGEAA